MRSASPWSGKATTVRSPPRTSARQLVLGLGQPARGDRGSLRLEGEGLAGGERVELDGVVERHGLELLFRPDLAHFAGLPDEVRAGRDR